MATQFPALEPRHRSFIARQHLFFTASAAEGTRVNVSPRPTDCLRILGDNAACYLDRTGSGNETAAHARAGGAMTLMFCAVAGPPLILRLYGKGRAIRRGSEVYAGLIDRHYGGEEPCGARQIMRIDFDLVQTSCGYGVPLFEYRGERPSMDNWTRKKLEAGPDALVAYQRENNSVSLDGLPTGLFETTEG